MGINSVISISKIRNTTAIRKKRRENGRRADLFGSNPHSKADGFSRSGLAFFEILELSTRSTMGRTRARVKFKAITPAASGPASWKLAVLVYYKGSFLISKLTCTETAILRLQSASTRQQLQTRSGDLLRSAL